MSTFTQSENIGELITALAKAQLEFTPALKDSDNPFFKSKYADLATNINAVRPALNRHGIAIIQADSSELERAIARVRTSLHCGEQWIASEAEAPAIDKSGNVNVQTLGSAWTYLRRYTLQAICGLASEDDDGNSLTNGMDGAKKPAQIAAEKKWDDIDPPHEITLNDQLKASNKLEAEKKVAAMRAELAEKQGIFSIEGDVLHCKIIGIEKLKKKSGEEYLSVTLNQRHPNGSQKASVWDTKLWQVIEKCLDHECKLKISVKGLYITVEDVLWFEGIPPVEGFEITNADIPF
jgi:hypothetical protein